MTKVEKKGTDKTVTEELTAVLEEIVETTAPEEKKKGEIVRVLEDNQILVGERQYKIVVDHREGFDAEKLGERFSDVLSRYDFIVGDWGYEQLRLKGFFSTDNRKVFPDQRIDSLEDYLYEFCNFGCAYFVLERVGGKRERKQNRRRRSKKPNQNVKETQAHTTEKKAPVQPVKKTKPTIKNRKTMNESKKAAPVRENREQKTGGFVIRKRED